MTQTTGDTAKKYNWLSICQLNDMLPNMGCCALVNSASGKTQQVAIFYLDFADGEPQLFAIDNYCPFSRSNVISRGIVGDLQGKTVVASPLYKQHFELCSGQCIEDKNICLNTYAVRLNGDTVELAIS